MKTFLALLSLGTLVYSANKTGSRRSNFDDRCERCLAKDYDYCYTDERLLTDSGRCCRDLIYAGDYCSNGYEHCTNSKVSDADPDSSDPDQIGTKSFFCARGDDDDCGQFELFVDRDAV